MFKKKGLYLFAILSLILLVVGCSSFRSSSDSDDYVEETAHGLKVALEIPDEILADVSVLTVEENTTINKAEIKLYQENELIESKTLENFSEDNEVVFAEVEVGDEYQVKADLIGAIRDEFESRVLYQGEIISPKIEANSITNVNVKVDPLPAESLKVMEINVNGDVGVDKVILSHPDGSQQSIKNYYTGSIIFTNEDLNLIPTRWELRVTLEDGSEGGKEVLLLPTEEKEVSLEVDAEEKDEDGEIAIEIVFHISPDAPTGLDLNEDGNLIWNSQDNVDVYNIYRTETNNPDELGLAIATVENNIYEGVEGGYYWVRAYVDGYSSGLSESFYVEKEIITTFVEEGGSIELNKEEYEVGDEVEITAVPEEGWEFVGWSGNLEGEENPRTIIVEDEMTIIAEFTYTEDHIAGSGTEEEPFMVYTLEGLERIGDEPAGYSLEAHYQLANDINATRTRNEDYNDGQGWNPIGDEYKGFRGVFDGNGFEISNFYINSGDNYIGLFGQVDEGEIKNIGLVDITIKIDGWNDYTGGLVGLNQGTIVNSYTKGDIEGVWSVGGLVGSNNWNGTIKGSYVNTNITSKERNVGGLVGYNDGTITESYAEGDVNGNEKAGGLVGNNWGEINTSYATGDIEGNDNIGGLVGSNGYGTIKNSYAKGSVIGNERVGGLTGYNDNGEISNTFSIGSVKGEDSAWGLIGLNNGTVGASYWNIETSGKTWSDGGEGKTTEELQQQSTYIDWDFDSIWTIDEANEYPELQLE